MPFSKKALALSSSKTLELTALANRLKSEGKKIVAFTAGEPDFNTPEYIKTEAHKAIDNNFTRYTPSLGTDRLRELVAEYESKRLTRRITKDEVFIAPGAKFAIFATLQLLVEDDDEVIIISPYWLSYPEMVTLAGGKTVLVETKLEDGFQLNPESLESAITRTTKAIIINSPNNPTGVVYTKNTLRSIGEILKKHPWVYLISDDIYENLIFEGAEKTTLAGCEPELFERCITINGVSKSFAMTGWRIGWGVASKEIVDIIGKILSHTVSSSVSISQKAAESALAGNMREVEQMRIQYEKRKNLISSLLKGIPGVRFVEPQGTFYLFLDVSQYTKNRFKSSIELSKYLLEEAGIVVVPGEPFGANGFIRLSYAISEEDIITGCERLKGALSKIAEQ